MMSEENYNTEARQKKQAEYFAHMLSEMMPNGFLAFYIDEESGDVECVDGCNKEYQRRAVKDRITEWMEDQEFYIFEEEDND